MANFLFLHGSWHGAWCWHKVLPQIHAAGHTASAIDLPGRGRAARAPFAVSLAHMVRAVIAALPADQRTTIVVHSRSGIVASTVAEAVPDRVARTIYLAAFLLPTGARVADYVPDRDSLLTGRIEIHRLGLWDWLDPTAYREALYADCSADDVALARALLVREPLRPALTRLRLSERGYGQVPRAFIRLTEDRAVSLALQDRWLNETAVDRVESLAASHSAYFSRPAELAARIIKLAAA
jgi:pimeloyl-ACP methyl ester carboxylesterase